MAAELNLYKRFVALFAEPALEYGQAISSTAESVTVELFQGGLLTVSSTEVWLAHSWVWIHREPGGWRLSPAPALTGVTVEV